MTSTSGPACPSCGETESLRGTAVDGDIAVACQTCGATWMRGALTCKSCGGEEILGRPQAMSRNPRGNQLAFVGWREVPLCRTCDADVLTASLPKNQPVPEGYVSACLFGPKDRDPVPTTSTPTTSRLRSDDDPTARRGPDPRPAVARAAPAPRKRASSGAPNPGRATSEPPTVRQAVEAFLASGFHDADSTAMLMLATWLGPSTRLNALGGREAAKELGAWFDRLYGPGAGKSRDSALPTVVGAIDFWRAKHWVADDPAAVLR